ncbi:hypothetical protein M758_3G134400 [Ceratodon purpureus]|nr:hypothetical protein M758_3G134400 [Ceratodon purpureus]
MATSEYSRNFPSDLKAEDVEAGNITKPVLSERELVSDGFDVLNFIEFQWDAVSTSGLRGHFLVTPKLCQPFGVLHGGITAFLAENLSSMGASVVSNWERVAGLDLNVNHLLSASIGETVHVKATPLRAGKRVQVWDVTFTKPVKSQNSSEPQAFATTAVARLTLLVGLPGPETAKVGNARLMGIARALSPADEISVAASKL